MRGVAMIGFGGRAVLGLIVRLSSWRKDATNIALLEAKRSGEVLVSFRVVAELFNFLAKWCEAGAEVSHILCIKSVMAVE